MNKGQLNNLEIEPVQFEEYIESLPLEMRPTKVMFDFKNNEQ
ncbi:hypothetical protein [Candidatus Brachybacter algidus]|nr:hypothetical protein [Candidatus Brachybacter algidus]